MPATTSAYNACGLPLSIDNAAGVLTNISGSANEVNLKLNRTIDSFKVFATAEVQYLECGKDAAVDLTVVGTRAVGEALDILEDWWVNGGGLRTFSFDEPNSNPGSVRWSMECLLESLDKAAKADEAKPVMVKASMKVSGAVSRQRIA